MRLAFYARGDLLVMKPGVWLTVGSPNQYVGRKHDPALRAYPATKEPFEVEANSDEGRRLTKLIRRDQSLWAANEATAKACGVEFMDLEFSNGEWISKRRSK